MRFRLLGFPVTVHPAFWLVSFLLSSAGDGAGPRLASAVAWVGIVFVSILVHELGHAFAMRSLGRSPSIELAGFGGVTSWGDGPHLSPSRVALVSLAGPFAGFLFAVPFGVLDASGLLPASGFVHECLRDVLFVNVGWGLVNLLPMLPLDGGRVAECGAFAVFGPKGARASYVVSLLVGVAVVGIAIRLQQTFTGLLAGYSIVDTWKRLRTDGVDPSVRERTTYSVDEETEALVEQAWDAIEHGSADEAAALCESRLAELEESDATAPSRAALAEALAWARLESGDDRDALAARARMPAEFRASDLLDARLLVARGLVEQGLAELERVFREQPGDDVAIVLAAASREAGRPERAVELLRTLPALRTTAKSHRVIEASLFYDDRFEDALAVSELAFARFGEGHFAYNAACSLARLGRPDEAFAWLGRAADAGFGDAEHLRDDADLASLRADERFEAIAARFGAARRS